ncbi:sialidase family protein [Arthrobacter glacialis]|uniref:sialidase family protein n=1 Tax=Arthrobacter glacialis TaxID=1664 RepID=UPI0013FD792A|nr:sialidase family protein [Arthrobacter glacialis]
MKFTDRKSRSKSRHVAAAAGVLAAGLLTSMMGPAFAQEAAPATATSEAPSYTEQFLAKRGDNAISASLAPFYRIPALADLGDGVVLASYDGRPNGGDSPAPNSIIQRRSTDGGKTWGAPTFIARGQIGSGANLQYGFSDPSYVVDKETGNVFNFFVYSKNQGFFGSVLGTDDSNRNVTGTALSVSTDKGLTWSTDPSNIPTLPAPQNYAPGSKYANFDGPLVTDVVKPVGVTVGAVNNVGGVVGQFASSGEGIQLKYGVRKGRLIQQFAGRVRNAAGTEVIQAYSVYSDDHGQTWKKGADVGSAMDENKVVELSNGDVMLNSRDNAGGGGRKVAISKDGGETWGPVTYNTVLKDPRNNAAIARMYPDAAQGSQQAKVLLFSNANASTRSNGTIRYSCDDGATWSAGKQFKDGYMAYSTVTALSDGTFGLLYESDSENIVFGKFNAEWLNPFCGAQVTAPALSGANGTTVQAQISVKNIGDTVLEGSTATFAPQAGWVFGSVAVPAVAVGQTAQVTVPVSIPSYAKAGTFNLTAKVSVGEESALGSVPVTITGGASTNIVGLVIEGSATDNARNLATNPYAVDSLVPYQFVVNSLSNVTAASVPVSGNFTPFIPADGAGNCRFSAVNVWAGYTCSTPKHKVTAAELADGFFVPLTTWQVTGTGATTQNYTIKGDEVNLVDRKPSVAVTVAPGVFENKDASGFASVGDVVSFAVTARNDGNVALTGVSLSGATGAAATLAVGASTVGTFKHTVTAADVTAKAVAAVSVAGVAKNGVKDVAKTGTGVAFALTLAPEPTAPATTAPATTAPATTAPATTAPATTAPATTAPATTAPATTAPATTAPATTAPATTVPATTAPATTAPATTAPSGSLSDDTVSAGGELTVNGKKFKPGSTATFTLHSDPVVLGTAVVRADGTVSLTAKLPANVPAGAHTVVIAGTGTDGQAVEVSLAVTVAAVDGAATSSASAASTTAAPTTVAAAADGLANTGFGLLPLGMVGGLLLLLGGVLAVRKISIRGARH